MQLGDILAGGARRARKPQQQPVIEDLAGRRIGEPDPARPTRFRQRSGDDGNRPGGLRAGDPDDGDGRASGRRRRRKDRVSIRAERSQCADGFF
jgi:hypothetical protein